jgi:capsular exopolysaccharide synthesis family protein
MSSTPLLDDRPRAVPQPSDPVVSALLAADSAVTEECRVLLARLRAVAETRPFKTLGVVSSCPGEGKTTIAMGLAMAMAQEPDRRVLLLEADLRKPSIETYLGLPHEPGLGDWLEGTEEHLRIRKLSPHGLGLIAAGRFRSARPELLRSARMSSLLAAAGREFDAIVVDCPPLAPVSDSVLLQDVLDGLILVVRARHAPMDAVRNAVGHLRPERVLGVVFNDQRDVLPRRFKYGYGYGYGYGRGYGRADEKGSGRSR